MQRYCGKKSSTGRRGGTVGGSGIGSWVGGGGIGGRGRVGGLGVGFRITSLASGTVLPCSAARPEAHEANSVLFLHAHNRLLPQGTTEKAQYTDKPF